MKPVTVNSVELPAPRPARAEAPASPAGVPFAETLQHAVATVDAIQLSADAEAAKLAQGDGNLHETMLALEKADVTMKVALKVRNKVIDAYNEVMRMSV